MSKIKVFKSKKSMKELKKMLVPSREVFKEFLDKDKNYIDARIKYYDALEELREIRMELGLTQADLAKLCGIPQTSISKIELGRRNVSIDKLITMANAMGKKLEIKLV
jgi:DNA-binding XRE family transcriptional regulator